MTLLVHLLLYPSEITDTQTRNSNLILISDYQSDYRSVTNSLLLWVHHCLHTITVLPLTTVYFVSELHCTVNIQYLTLLSLHNITVLPLTTVYFVSEVHCTVNIQYLTLLSLHTITVLPLTTVYFVSEVHCTVNIQYLTLLSLHTITVLTHYYD